MLVFVRRNGARPSAMRRALQQQQQHPRSRLQLRSFSRHEAASAVRAAREREPVPILQTIAVDRFGRQHRVEHHYRQFQQHEQHTRLALAKWATGLLATGACVAVTLGEDGRAHAASASSGKNGDNTSGDLVEQLKKKIEELIAANPAIPASIDEFQQQINEFLASGKGGQISWGFMMGVCSGFALKKVSKVGAVALGTVFIMLQCASYTGYIDVNYKKIERDVMDMLDINKDGQFDSKDIDEVYKSLMKVLEFSLPAGSGFAVGFMVGFRAG